MKNRTEGGGRDFKICRNIMWPIQETKTVYVAPKCLQNNLMTPGRAPGFRNEMYLETYILCSSIFFLCVMLSIRAL